MVWGQCVGVEQWVGGRFLGKQDRVSCVRDLQVEVLEVGVFEEDYQEVMVLEVIGSCHVCIGGLSSCGGGFGMVFFV